MRKALSISCVTVMEVTLAVSLRLIINSSITEAMTGSRPAEGNALAHAATQFLRQQLFGILHADEVQFLIDDFVNLIARFIGELFQRQSNILAHVAAREKRGILVHHAHVLPD